MTKSRKLTRMCDIVPTDYEKWKTRNWWTWQLLHFVRGMWGEPKHEPECALALPYDNSIEGMNRNAPDYLEHELRLALNGNDAKIPIVPGSELRADGHRLIKAVDGLRFVQKNMGGINAKVKAEHDASKARLLKRIKEWREELIKQGKDPGTDPQLKHFKENPPYEPSGLFIPDAFLDMLNGAQSEAQTDTQPKDDSHSLEPATEAMLTVSEAAKFLGVENYTISRWCEGSNPKLANNGVKGKARRISLHAAQEFTRIRNAKYGEETDEQVERKLAAARMKMQGKSASN